MNSSVNVEENAVPKNPNINNALTAAASKLDNRTPSLMAEIIPTIPPIIIRTIIPITMEVNKVATAINRIINKKTTASLEAIGEIKMKTATNTETRETKREVTTTRMASKMADTKVETITQVVLEETIELFYLNLCLFNNLYNNFFLYSKSQIS